jgi:ABC-2 type transport system ATP-binding protein
MPASFTATQLCADVCLEPDAMAAPLIVLEKLRKVYTRGHLVRRPTFTLEADLAIDSPCVVGVVGPNGAGKSTLFEMMTGSNEPTQGRVLVTGTDIHRVKYRERDRLAIHYHQSYQVRRFRKLVPSVFLARSPMLRPVVHLFDEPQLNTLDGYIGFMLDFFRQLRSEGRLVFVCLHPTAGYHLEILSEIAERYLLVADGKVTEMPDFRSLVADERMRTYLGADMTRVAEALI